MCTNFLLLTGATWYFLGIYIVFTYFASFTGYEDDIFEFISNFHIQGSKFGKKFDKFGRKSFKEIYSAMFMEFVFSKSGVRPKIQGFYVSLDELVSLGQGPRNGTFFTVKV